MTASSMAMAGSAAMAGAVGSAGSLARRIGPLGIACLAIVIAAVVVAVAGPLLPGLEPTKTSPLNAWVGPLQVDGHLLGFDGQGRDLLSRLVFGARTAMVGPLIVLALSMFLGIGIGLFAAWFGGRVDSVLSAGLDVLFGFPGILLAILAAAVFGAGLVAAGTALAIAYTPYVARVVRAAAMRERRMDYVAALEVQGLSPVAIAIRHAIPNLAPVLVAQATILFGYALVDMVAISFLGLGVPPPNADWGVMVGENLVGALQGYALPSLSAGTAIVVVVVAVNLLGERLLDVSEGRR
jgi:peptide/nickel transport system permease protein